MGVLELSAPSCEVESFFSLQLLLTPGGEHFFADVAQLVEQLIRNQQVSGSSPLVGFKSIIIRQLGESSAG